MSLRTFLIWIFICTLINATALTAMHLIFPEWCYQAFDITNTIFYTIMSFLVFFVAQKAAQDPNPYKFSRFFMAFSFIKIVLSIVLIAVFVKLAGINNRMFLLTFLITYICFTVLETYVFMTLSKSPIKED